MLKKLFVILTIAATSLTARAQDLEYLMDIGGGVGLCYYAGDAGTTPFAHSSFMAALNFRRILNPRMALKTNLAWGRYGGSTEGKFFPTDAGSVSPEGGVPMKIDFSGSVLDLSEQFEFNFLGFGSGPSYKKLSRITPYITAGFGMTLGMGEGETGFGINIPVGIGVKYKLKPRLNIGAEWTYRFSSVDCLDSSRLVDPYGVKSSFMKNKDAYSFFEIFISYEICPKLRKCNN